MQIQWVGVTEADTFAAVQCGSRYTDRTVQVAGTFGSATVNIQGSINGTSYVTLTGHDGAATFTTDDIKALIECTPYLQCTHSGGTSESVTVTLRCVDNGV